MLWHELIYSFTEQLSESSFLATSITTGIKELIFEGISVNEGTKGKL